jgi:hypothetical protein
LSGNLSAGQGEFMESTESKSFTAFLWWWTNWEKLKKELYACMQTAKRKACSVMRERTVTSQVFIKFWNKKLFYLYWLKFHKDLKPFEFI